MRIPVIPDYYKGLPDSTRLVTADVLDIFDYKNKTSMNVHINRGDVPAPIYSKDGSVGSMNNRNKYWLLGDIRKLRNELLK